MKNKPFLNSTAPLTIGSLLASAGAHGAIQYYDASHQFSVGFGSNAPVDWNIDNSGIHEVDVNPYGGGSYLYLFQNKSFTAGQSWGGVRSNGVAALKNLAVNYTVGPGVSVMHNVTLIYSSDLSEVNGFISGVQGYFGFTFNTTGTKLYGWASATIFEGGSGGITIHEWAYEDSGASIAVGDTGVVPEPATTAAGLAGLALGAAGLRRWRKSKAA